jgi:phosphate transport system protein
VFREGRELDDELDAALRHLMTFVFEDPTLVGQVLDIVFAIRALESIGDHAANIAEQVVFVAKGRDIRYQNKEILIETLSRRNR